MDQTPMRWRKLAWPNTKFQPSPGHRSEAVNARYARASAGKIAFATGPSAGTRRGPSGRVHSTHQLSFSPTARGWSDAGEAGADAVAFDHLPLSRRVIQTGPPGLACNCHGWVFAAGLAWVQCSSVERI